MSGTTAIKQINPWMIALIVSLATFMEVLDTTITNVSIGHIAGSLGASTDESTWVLTSYLVANGIILPLSGWLAGVMGRKNFFLACIAGFTASSFACGASSSLAMLIVFRLIQGAAGGGLQPTQQAILVDLFPISKRGQVFALTGITMIVAPILGPTLGGWITDNFSWRWIFYINLPVGIFAFLMVLRYVEDPPHAKAKGAMKVDYWGLGLIGIGLGALQIMLDKGQQDDWFDSNFIVAMVALSVACLGGAILWLLRQEDPLVDLHLLRDRGFAMSCILIFVTGFVLYGGSTLLPLLLQSHFGYNATLAGLVLSPSALIVLFLMPIVGKLVSKVPARNLVILGLLLCGFGMWLTTHLTPQSDYHAFLIMRFFQVLGLPFLFIPISTLAFLNIPKEKSSKASALFSLFRNIGGSFGIAMAIAHIARRAQFHQQVLAAHASTSSPVLQEALAHGTRVTGSLEGAQQHLYGELLVQSSIMGYVDTFALLALLMAISAVVATILLPKNKPGTGGAPAGAH